MSVGIKRSGVLEILSVALVVDAQPIGWKGRADKPLGRVGCRRERFSLRRTGHWGRSGAGRAPVCGEVKGEVGAMGACVGLSGRFTGVVADSLGVDRFRAPVCVPADVEERPLLRLEKSHPG